MWKIIAYKYGKQYGIKTGKNAVLSMLIQETGKPNNVIYHKRSVTVFYADDKFTERYTVLINYWTSRIIVKEKEGIEK